MDAEINLWCAWLGILLGMVAGAVQGLFFHRPEWLGGYDSWPRRLTRLGHISFFGLAFINLAFHFTVRAVADGDSVATAASPVLLQTASLLFVVGAFLMPLVCYLSAWRKSWRHIFALPVVSLLTAIVALLFWRF